MEANKKININEAQLRQLIREELKEYLIEEGFLGDTMQKFANGTNLRKVFNGTIIALLLGLGGHSERLVLASAAPETQKDLIQQFDQLSEEQQQSLMAYGLTSHGAEQLVAGVMVGAKEIKEEELKYNQELTDEEKEKQIFDYQVEEVKKLGNKEIVTTILTSKFLEKMSAQGAHTLVAANTRGGGMGAPTSLTATMIGLGQEFQQNLMQHEDEEDTTIKRNGKIGINVMDLETYWGDIVADNTSLQRDLKSKLGTIYISNSDYEFAAGEVVQNSIQSQLQKENKVNKLKERLNKIRGFYV